MPIASLSIGALAAVACISTSALACALIDEGGRILPVGSEDILIIWDESKGRQHLIRTSQWDHEGRAGYLIPTPSRPDIGEANSEVLRIAFDAFRAAQPETIGCSEPLGPMAAASAVEVLERKDVAGYEAAILKADEAGALSAWLKAEGFPSNPSLEEWIKPYVEKGFYLAAFRYLGRPKPDKAVRISFDTPRVWHPFREPEGGPTTGSRLFRATILAPQPMALDGKEGSKLPVGRWHWTATVSAEDSRAIAEAASLPDLKANGWHLSQFFDYNPAPRLDSDLTFKSDATLAARPPSPALWIMAAVAVGMAMLVRAIRLRRAKRAPAAE
jgi:hypothetical protein